MQPRVAKITAYDDGVVGVDTEYVRANLDASHLIVENERAAFVDTGSNNSVPLLLDALRQQDLEASDVDYVFLTHIHLDHAGGAGLLMRNLPNATCVVHPRGAPHMIDPSKLVAGTEAVYGVKETAELYGTIAPIDAERVYVPADNEEITLNGRPLQILYTEGHARHHYCLNDPQSRGVFTGDNFGVSYRELDTEAGAFIFPTTTPASFDPNEAHKSIDRIMACEPNAVFLTHYSRVTELKRLARDLHERLDAFEQLTRAESTKPNAAERIERSLFDYLYAEVEAHGYNGGRTTFRDLIGFDIKLNAMGLAVWLKRQEH